MLTVRDVMQSPVVSVTADTSVRRLARVLSDAEISGCPVLDAHGKVVGVVSATDILRVAADEADVHLAAARVPQRATVSVEASDDEPAEPGGYFLPEDPPILGDQPLGLLESELDSMAVSDIMTPVTFSVGPDMDLVALSRFLVHGGIHRAVVLEDGHLLGIVTSHDVLEAVSEGRLG